MKRPYPGVNPLAGIVTTFLDNVGRRSIVDATQEDIEASRAQVYPTWPPFSWVTGRVDPTVRIDEGSAPARDGAPIRRGSSTAGRAAEASPAKWMTPCAAPA